MLAFCFDEHGTNAETESKDTDNAMRQATTNTTADAPDFLSIAFIGCVKITMNENRLARL